MTPLLAGGGSRRPLANKRCDPRRIPGTTPRGEWPHGWPLAYLQNRSRVRASIVLICGTSQIFAHDFAHKRGRETQGQRVCAMSRRAGGAAPSSSRAQTRRRLMDGLRAFKKARAVRPLQAFGWYSRREQLGDTQGGHGLPTSSLTTIPCLSAGTYGRRCPLRNHRFWLFSPPCSPLTVLARGSSRPLRSKKAIRSGPSLRCGPRGFAGPLRP